MEDSSANVKTFVLNPDPQIFCKVFALHSADEVYYPESNELRFSTPTENHRHVRNMRNMCLGAERHADNVLRSLKSRV